MNGTKYFSEVYLKKILKTSSVLFIITLLSFSFFLFNDLFLNPHFSGDEGKYLSDLLKANHYGLAKAISDGASITYLVISYYLDKLIGAPLITLKLTSLIFGSLMFLVLCFFNSIYIKLKYPLNKHLFFWIIYLLIIQTTLFTGVNDILLDFFGTLLFMTLFLRQRNILINAILMGLFLALILATRKMAITYLFVFLLVFIIIALFTKRDKLFNFKNGLIVIFSFIFFFLLFNIHPLIQHKKLSFDEKILQGNVNWAQWDYHNALLIDKGMQERFTHVNIKETDKYLKQNGINSLPSSFLEMVFFNPLLTIKEFFIDSIIGLKYIFRQTGFLILPFIIFLFYRIKNILTTKTVSSADFIYLFSTCYFFLICFIVIANIQARWFMFFMPIMILLIGKDLSTLKMNNQILFSIGNNILLIVMCFPYLFEKFSKYF